MKIQNRYKARVDNDSFSYKKKMASNGTFKISDWIKRRKEQGKPVGYGSAQTKFLLKIWLPNFTSFLNKIIT